MPCFRSLPRSISRATSSSEGVLRRSGRAACTPWVATAVAGLFGVNTITGSLNWWETRAQPGGRTWRTAHAALMLLADAGFTATGLLADEAEDWRQAPPASHGCGHVDVGGGPVVRDDAFTIPEGLRCPFSRHWSRPSSRGPGFLFRLHADAGGGDLAHVGGMLWGGGLALSADRAVWKLRTAAAEERTRLLAEIGRLHPAVLTGLGISVLSGLLLTAADLEEFATSPFWWRKVVMVGFLLANGAWLQRQERRMRAAPATVPPSGSC